ncbi:hypothetical protein AZE42_04054 [Rhizopogon vesiculosus]|uniref:Uncharacterized protein n=1 Tax=Rhizopogon vesiculosus TaxID=180088 RepID=A0A1J8QR18_9AGAM|nr:hypothetical protein AZE42_04054 [Rhizopogon vesiculosus]
MSRVDQVPAHLRPLANTSTRFVFRSTTSNTPPKCPGEDVPSETEPEVVSSPSSPPRGRGSPVQSPPGVPSNDEARLRRALASTSTISLRPRTRDSPLKTPSAEEQTTPPSFTPPGTPPSFLPLHSRLCHVVFRRVLPLEL